MIKEFKEFLLRGNVIDLAVAVVIGAAFSAIVTSLVQDIIEPIIAALFNAEAISKVTVTIGTAELGVGAFVGAIINFIIVGFVLFLVVKGVNAATSFKKPKEEIIEEAAPTAEDYLKEIRDLLARK